MRDAYIVQSVRTPGCRRKKGALAQTRPEALLVTALNGLMERAKVDRAVVEDIMIGCAFPEAEQGLNIGRVCGLMAGFPIEVPGATVNRFCSSGLEAITISAMRIMSGWAEVAIGGGLESMSIVPMGGNMPRPNPEWARENSDVYISMGITAENVANRYKITREMQDEFGYHSQMKAVAAQKNGEYNEIIPTPAVRYVTKPDGTVEQENFTQDFDDGVRESTTIEGLGKLRPAFSAMGSVTAGNSSQTTDGAAATLIMSEEACRKYGVTPIAKIKAYTVAGVEPDEMGVGPAYAIPKLMKLVPDVQMKDVGIFEINEAFASQALYCAQQLGLDDKKEWSLDSKDRRVNINGGAIALGHPLGCTGAKLCAQIINQMQKKGIKYGVESMCIGGGMGAAAMFELVEKW